MDDSAIQAPGRDARDEGDRKLSPFQGPCHLQPTEAPDGPCQSSDGLQITHLVETESHLRCEACRVSLTREMICPLCAAHHAAPCPICRRRAYHLDGCRIQELDREARRRFTSPAATAFSCSMGADPLPGGVGV